MHDDLIKQKVAQAAAMLNETGIDCWITFVRETALNGDPILDYLVPGNLTWHSAFIISSTGGTCAIVGKYDRQMVVDTGAYAEVFDYVQGIREPFLAYMNTLHPRSVAVNYSMDSEICDGITHGMYLTLMDMLKEVRLDGCVISAEPVISALRQRKSPRELAAIREAIRHTEEIYDHAGAAIRPGMTEAHIAAVMREEVARRGLGFAWDPHSCPSVFTGPDTAGAHYAPTERAVQTGHVLNMDFGVKVDGYVSDIQRTYYVLRQGESVAPPEVQRGFDTIARAIESARLVMKPGVEGIVVDGVARTIITAAGYEEFPHALGHQVGRFAHDGTALLAPQWEKYGRKPFILLEEGMVFTIEPRLTVPGHGVVTVEEMVVLTKDGAEYLSRAQKALRYIRAS
jgi:Xaa-Pro aminopeptidase